MQLRQQVAELTRQANGAGSPGEQPAAPSEQGVRGGPEHRESPDEPAAAAENAQVSGDFQQMVAENNQLRETVERLQAQFTTVVTQLQKQIQALSQKLGGPDVEADQAPARSGADASSNASPDRAADEEPRDASPAQSDETASSTSRTVDDLMRDNQQLRAQLEQMVAQFTQVISQLKQQIEQLSAQVKARTA
jgi:molecular chaperone GrpE (heat shock protein)